MVVDLSGIRTAQPLKYNPLLVSGDEVYVPRVKDEVILLGEVVAPTTFAVPVGANLSLLKLLGKAGQALTPQADRSQAIVLKKGQPPIHVDLHSLLVEGDLSKDVPLTGGEVVVIKEAEKISVIGEVNSPTTFPSSRPVTLLEALAAAGGFTPQADLKAARIVSADGTARTVDIDALWRTGTMPADAQVRPGDVLVIPKSKPQMVLVMGAVTQSTTLDLRGQEDVRLLQALTIAGPTAASDLQRVSVYRGDKCIVVDARSIIEQGNLADNIRLQADDVVYVPESKGVYVLGGVNRPGKIHMRPDMTLLDAIAAAGGALPRAQLARVVVARVRPDGTAEHIRVNLAVYTKGQVPEPVKLKAGDIVYVPYRGQPTTDVWRLLRDSLWVIGTIVSITR